MPITESLSAKNHRGFVSPQIHIRRKQAWSIHKRSFFLHGRFPPGNISHKRNPITYRRRQQESPRFAQLQADYLYTFANEGQLEAGIHFFSRWNKTRYYFHDKAQNSEEWVNTPNLNQGLDHSEFVYSAYLSYSRQWGEQFSCKIGLYSDYDISRTTLLYTNKKNNTNRFYPYPRLTIQYHLSDRQELALHFNRESTGGLRSTQPVHEPDRSDHFWTWQSFSTPGDHEPDRTPILRDG